MAEQRGIERIERGDEGDAEGSEQALVLDGFIENRARDEGASDGRGDAGALEFCCFALEDGAGGTKPLKEIHGTAGAEVGREA